MRKRQLYLNNQYTTNEKGRGKRSRLKTIGMTAALLSMVSLVTPAAVYAAPQTDTETQEVTSASAFEMSTAYPGISVKPGETTTFDLDFINQTGSGQDAALSIKDLPDGWNGYFRGNGGQINKVHIQSSKDVSEGLATLSLTVPEGTAEGDYNVTVEAVTDDGETSDVTLTLNVSEEENGASTFTAEYAEQQAASGTAFSFDTTLVNNKGTEQSFSLSAEAPEGWQVTFTPSGESNAVASLNVDAGASQGITVAITPPETLTQGDYTIPISAISSSEKLSTELKMTITGSYAVEVSTPSGNLSVDAYANAKKAVTLSITNTGNVDLTNLNLTSSAARNWDVIFDESTIDLLEAGATKEVTAYITPDSDAITGDYVASVTAANDVATSTASLRVSVKTRTSWGLAAVAIIVVLGAGLGYVFKKYGRR